MIAKVAAITGYTALSSSKVVAPTKQESKMFYILEFSSTK